MSCYCKGSLRFVSISSWQRFIGVGNIPVTRHTFPQNELYCYDFPLDLYLYSYAQHSAVLHSTLQLILSQLNLIFTHPFVPSDLCLFQLDYTAPTYLLLITH